MPENLGTRCTPEVTEKGRLSSLGFATYSMPSRDLSVREPVVGCVAVVGVRYGKREQALVGLQCRSVTSARRESCQDMPGGGSSPRLVNVHRKIMTFRSAGPGVGSRVNSGQSRDTGASSSVATAVQSWPRAPVDERGCLPPTSAMRRANPEPRCAGFRSVAPKGSSMRVQSQINHSACGMIAAVRVLFVITK